MMKKGPYRPACFGTKELSPSSPICSKCPWLEECKVELRRGLIGKKEAKQENEPKSDP